MKTRASLATLIITPERRWHGDPSTENGFSNGGGEGHGIIGSRGDDVRSVAGRGCVSKAAEQRGPAVEMPELRKPGELQPVIITNTAIGSCCINGSSDLSIRGCRLIRGDGSAEFTCRPRSQRPRRVESVA